MGLVQKKFIILVNRRKQFLKFYPSLHNFSFFLFLAYVIFLSIFGMSRFHKMGSVNLTLLFLVWKKKIQNRSTYSKFDPFSFKIGVNIFPYQKKKKQTNKQTNIPTLDKFLNLIPFITYALPLKLVQKLKF